MDGAAERIHAARLRERAALNELERRLRAIEQRHVHARQRLEAFESRFGALRRSDRER